MDVIDTLIKDQAQLHIVKGNNISHDFHSNINLLKKLKQILNSNHQTLEIGSGWSTVIFTQISTQHICITPYQPEIELVKNYCNQKKIDTNKTTFICERSEFVLPKLPTEATFDVVLIDGRHAFPSPIIDWFYTAIHLKLGGTMIIDDINIRSCQIVYQFMKSDNNWKLKEQHQNYALFIKQGYNINTSWWRKENFSKYKMGLGGILERIKFEVGRKLKQRK